MSKVLYYFTASFPYGIGESWKRHELDVLINHFQTIVVCPFSYAGNFEAKEVPVRVLIQKPLLTEISNLKKHILKLFTGGNFFYYLHEFFEKRVYLKKSHIVNWLVAAIETELAWRSQTIREIFGLSKDVVLYFFWAREWAYIIPLLRRRGYTNTIVRFHGYDLYEDRKENQGYIPFRSQLLRSLHSAIMLSNSAEEYIHKKYPEISFRSMVIPLGTKEVGTALVSGDGLLRIVSCSSIIPLKRLSLIAQALNYADISVEWTHIGDGPLMDEVKDLVKTLPKNVACHLIGKLRPEEVVPYYNNKAFDVFLNVSETEGLPVSIMEAFSAGIPAIATDVGGTSALVNSSTGFLIDKDVSTKCIWEALFRFYSLAPQTKIKLREGAYQLFRSKYDALKNAEKLSSFLDKSLRILQE